jgi:N-acetyltransferase 10
MTSVRKKVDSRIRTLIENGVRTRHRSMFVLVGDKSRAQIVNLHYMLSKATVRTRPSVLWCYEKELGFVTHRKKRLKKLKRDIRRGVRDIDEQNPFELFVASTDIRYCYYKDTHKILGNTYGMCVLQDFNALTPNLLARTIETVEGGGIIVLLLKTMQSLKQLYTMSMNVHQRFRTESHQHVVNRFNERFMLSLGVNKQCLVLDDELNILPLSSHVKKIKKVVIADQEMDEKGDAILSENDVELRALKTEMQDTQPIGALVDSCKTLDQAKAVLTFVEAIAEKTLRSTVVTTAARGRGKSAALGIAMAGAIAYGYSNIFVTAPSPENLRTLFEMVLKGFDALEYQEHQDYEIVQSTNPDFHKAIVRINIFREHRQTIQYIQPQDYMRLGQAELLVIDEAAAIPLPIVKRLLGNYLVFMSSTVNGYEGTGRSLSLKLVADLRKESAAVTNSSSDSKTNGSNTSAAISGRTLRELTLEEPIRYGPSDPVESWLNELLCLDCTSHIPKLSGSLPHPSDCELFYVNRDTLFSFHRATEEFLQRMMSLFVSSHYRNTPNDLQLLSDAPAHHLFVLVGPINENNQNQLPDILCAVQVCLEGHISKDTVAQNLARGIRKSGDLIPWTISQQFQDSEFAGLSGARVVRVATHPDLQRMGYGSRALELLIDYYEGKFANISESGPSNKAASSSSSSDTTMSGPATSGDSKSLLSETIAPRVLNHPLLENLTDRPPEALQWLGVSYGLTRDLFNFWQRNKFIPVYLRQTSNELTGEHTCIMLRAQGGTALQTVSDTQWADNFVSDFSRRFVSLLSMSFSHFSCALALAIVSCRKTDKSKDVAAMREISYHFTEYDLRRLESYAQNLVDHHMIFDLTPSLARLYLLNKFNIRLSNAQAAILVAIGLQNKRVNDTAAELAITPKQVLAIFNKTVRKVSSYLRSMEESDIKSSLPQASASRRKAVSLMKPVQETLHSELKRGEIETQKKMRDKQRALLDGMQLDGYAIGGTEEDWDKALKSGKATKQGVSLKSSGDKHSSSTTPSSKRKARSKSKGSSRKKTRL